MRAAVRPHGPFEARDQLSHYVRRAQVPFLNLCPRFRACPAEVPLAWSCGQGTGSADRAQERRASLGRRNSELGVIKPRVKRYRRMHQLREATTVAVKRLRLFKL